MNTEFLSPIEDDLVELTKSLSVESIGNSIRKHTLKDGVPDLKDVHIAIIGVKESRASINNNGSGSTFKMIRREFYSLYPGKWKLCIADLGDVNPGHSIADTYYVLKQLISSLIKRNILPVILGGGQDLTYSNYRAYDDLEQTVNLLTIDNKFDLGDVEDDLNSNNFLSKVIMDSPNNLFNFSNLGYQSCFNSVKEVELLNKMYFDTYRLGSLKDLSIVEPIIRSADIISLDLSSVSSVYAPANNNATVNGFNGFEICALSRYSGISDKVSSFGIYEYNPELDNNSKTAGLIAQIIWYFMEGFNFRVKDFPFSNKSDLQKFTVVFEQDDSINFYRSEKTGRWWMELSLISHNKNKRHTFIPCTYQDYKSALDSKIPERWYKTQQKLI